MIAILAGIRKELMILSRDPAALVMLFILPSIFILVLSLAMQGAFANKNGKEKFDLLVVNQDEGDFGSKLMENLEVNGYFKVDLQPSVETAKRLMEQGGHPLLIVIPKGASHTLTHGNGEDIILYQDPAFSKEMAHNVMGGIREFVFKSLLDKVKDAASKQSEAITTLEKHVDTLADRLKSTAKTAKDLGKKLKDIGRKTAAFGIRISIASIDTDSDELDTDADEFKKVETPKEIPESTGLKVSQQYTNYGNEKTVKPSSVQQNVPGWTIFALFWIAQVLAINIISERQSGAYKRVMASPISFPTYIFAKSIPFFLINLLQAAFLFLLGVYVLPHLGCEKLVILNAGALAVLTMSVSQVAVSFGLLFAGFLATPFAAASVAASVLIVMTATAGIMVPKFVMPEAMQQLSGYIPQGIALEGYLDVLLRGKGVFEILPAIGKLYLFAGGFTLIGLLRMRRME
jgi:ABC-2 type transport system permease protein